MIPYKPASLAALEGYAGTSASGFRTEIEARRKLGQLEDLLEYFGRRQGGASIGNPAGPRIARTLDDAADRQGPWSAMIADRARLRVMLASLARSLHVGVLDDCFFDPDTALCLKQVTHTNAQPPLTALCQPTRCPNACITARLRPGWKRSVQEVRILLKERRLSDLQHAALTAELHRLTTVIEAIDPAPPGTIPG